MNSRQRSLVKQWQSTRNRAKIRFYSLSYSSPRDPNPGPRFSKNKCDGSVGRGQRTPRQQLVWRPQRFPPGRWDVARSDDAETRAARWEKEAHDLSTQVAFLQEELALVRRKLTESPRHVRQLEERLAATQAQLARLTENNERLVATLKEARAQIVTLKEEIDRLAQPPSGYGVFLTASRRRHGRHLHRRPQAAGGGVTRRCDPTTCGAGRKCCSTTRSTSSTRSGSSAPARSSCSRRSSTAAIGHWSISHADEERIVSSPTR